jgi:IS30 family transposase
MSHEHLTLKRRFKLEAWIEIGLTQEEMARRLGVVSSTVSRELSQAGGRGNYDAKKAHSLSKKRRKVSKRKTKKLFSDPVLHEYVRQRLSLFWSPEQIAGRMEGDIGRRICHETIYAFVYEEKPEWKIYLRQKKGKYRRRGGTKARGKRREEAKKERIDSRPRIVETRERLGDWEGDTIVGGEKTTGILTHVERRSGYLLADLLPRKTAEAVRAKTRKRFSKIPAHTITYDNGIEFSAHEFIGKETGADIYFAYPYHSWERGTNENTNGLLRQFFPKRSLFGILTQKDVERAMDLINHRPRKRLGYLTPHEVFVEGKSVAIQNRI